MCLRFDPVENTLQQTCSGKCKNKCGFKVDEDVHRALSSSTEPKVVRIGKVGQERNHFQASPLKGKILGNKSY